VLLAGCGNGRQPAGIRVPSLPDQPGRTEAAPQAAPPLFIEARADEAPAGPLEPAWSRVYPEVIAASVSADGTRVLVSTVVADQWSRRVGWSVLDAEGKVLWDFRPSGARFRSGRAEFLGDGGVVGAYALTYNDDGTFYFLDPTGRVLWTRGIRGPVTAVAPASATRVALVGHLSGDLMFLDGGGKVLARLPVSPRATARFTRDGSRLLVVDEDRVLLLDGDGLVVHSQNFPATVRRDVAISRDGRWLAATTGEPDNTLYLLDGGGRPVGSARLLPGGPSRLEFSPEGRKLVVFDVGERAGIYWFDLPAGPLPTGDARTPGTLEPRWRLLFDESRGDVHVQWVAFTAGEDALLVLLGVHRGNHDQQAGEERVLVRLSGDGRLEWRLSLGYNVDAAVSADRRVMVTSTNHPVTDAGRVSNETSYYRLEEPAGTE